MSRHLGAGPYRTKADCDLSSSDHQTTDPGNLLSAVASCPAGITARGGETASTPKLNPHPQQQFRFQLVLPFPLAPCSRLPVCGSSLHRGTLWRSSGIERRCASDMERFERAWISIDPHRDSHDAVCRMPYADATVIRLSDRRGMRFRCSYGPIRRKFPHRGKAENTSNRSADPLTARHPSF